MLLAAAGLKRGAAWLSRCSSAEAAPWFYLSRSFSVQPISSPRHLGFSSPPWLRWQVTPKDGSDPLGTSLPDWGRAGVGYPRVTTSAEHSESIFNTKYGNSHLRGGFRDICQCFNWFRSKSREFSDAAKGNVCQKKFIYT